MRHIKGAKSFGQLFIQVIAIGIADVQAQKGYVRSEVDLIERGFGPL
jgi:hypothetical protein